MAKIKWKNHLREFFIVVFGILLAFQLDRCSVDNSQQKLITEHIDYIIEETNLNSYSLNAQIELSQKNLKKVDTLIGLVIAKGDTKIINNMSYGIFNVGYLYIRRNAYNSLINSGDIRFLKSFDLKKDIIDIYEYYTWTQSLDQGCRAAFEDDFFPYIKTNFDLVTSKLQESDIYYSKRFLNALSTYRFALNLKISKFKDCKKEIEEFQKSIKLHRD